MDEESFSIRNTTRRRIPRLPFREMKDAALGKGYDLSVVFCADKLSRRLNRTHRDKDKPTNVLSFPVDDSQGEIFLDLPLAERQAPSFGRAYENFVGFLFIHALVHLKGFDHGSKMEAEELKIRRMFGI